MFPLFICQHFSQAIVIFVIIVHLSCFVIILQNFSCLLPSLLILLTCFLTYPPHTTPHFECFLMSYISEAQLITSIRKKKRNKPAAWGGGLQEGWLWTVMWGWVGHRICGEARDYSFITTMSINNSESYIDMDVVQWRQTKYCIEYRVYEMWKRREWLYMNGWHIVCAFGMGMKIQKRK